MHPALRHFYYSSSRGGFNADSISNLLLDFDADKGITQSGTVSAWADQKSGLILAQGTATNQPTYLTDEINGHAAVSFDGVDNYLSRSGDIDGLINEANLTIFIVSNGGVFCYQNDNELTSRAIQLSQNNSTSSLVTRIAREGVDGFGAVSRTDGSDYTIKEVLYRGAQATNATKLRLFIDGSEQTPSFTGTIGATTFTTGASKLLLMGAVDVGALSFIAGKFTRLIVYQRALTDGERATVEAGLSTTYGL